MSYDRFKLKIFYRVTLCCKGHNRIPASLCQGSNPHGPRFDPAQ